jgi:hypothetical protein
LPRSWASSPWSASSSGVRGVLAPPARCSGALVASISLAGAGAAALGHWLDLRSGSLDYAGTVIHPAPAVAYFAAIAIAGMVAALVLLGSWLHPGDPDENQ